MAREILTFTSPQSDVISFNTRTDHHMQLGREGFYAPPIDNEVYSIAGVDGSAHKSSRGRERMLKIPFFIQSPSRKILQDDLASIFSALNPFLGVGIFAYTDEEGDQVQIRCKYDSHEIKEGNTWAELEVNFEAADPWWEGIAVITKSFVAGETKKFFPFGFPFTLSPSDIAASLTINYNADIATFPSFVITGAGENIALINNSTNKRFDIDLILASNEQVTINFDPRTSGFLITSQGGANLFSSIDQEQAETWTIDRGINDLSLSMTATDVNSAIEISYIKKGFTPYGDYVT